MTQKQIIKLIAQWFNLSDILALQDYGGSVETVNSQATAEIEDIRQCIDLVVDEIACDYFPLLNVEQVSPNSDCQILFSQLSKTILKVFSLKTLSNLNVSYKCFPNYLLVSSRETLLLTYSHVPTPPATESSALDIVSSPINARIVAYGVAREYCIKNSLFDKADYYNSRFCNALEKIITKSSAIKLPKRRWI